MPRRTRHRIVGKWERIEQEDREEELKELERELHGEQRHDRKAKPKRRRQQAQRPKPDAPDVGIGQDNGIDSTASNG